MELSERQRHVSRIVAGQLRLTVDNTPILVKSPTAYQKWMAEEAFLFQREAAERDGAYTDEQLLAFLDKKGIWTLEDSAKQKQLVQNVEDLKVKLFQLMFRSLERSAIRKALKDTRKELGRLEILEHSYDNISCKGIAEAARQRYLICASIFKLDGGPFWPEEDMWEQSDPFSEKILIKLNEQRLTEEDIRELARTDPWATMWGLRRHCNKGVFDLTVSELSDEQKALLVWSGVYESIRECQDAPAGDVIDDNDMLDGWMIIRKREADANKAKKAGEEFTSNSKIANADEIFIPANTVGDAKRVMMMNDQQAQVTAQQRLATVRQQGEVKEQNLPDVKRKIQMQATQMYADSVKQGKAKG